jgi:pyruvate formate lyase activating enzyme
MDKCKVCGKNYEIISKELGVCLPCIRGRFNEAKHFIDAAHRTARRELSLPENIPHEKGGLLCDICVNRCVMAKGTAGYCGIRKNEGGRILDFGGATLNWNFEDMPSGISADAKHERALSVFYGACSYNCLYCHSWHFLDHIKQPNVVSAELLASQVDERTKGVFFHGGDPTPQIEHAIASAKIITNRNKNIKISFETNGSMRKDLMLTVAGIAKDSGGTIKFDIKAWDDHLHYALTGVSNEWALENFSAISKMGINIIASTLLVPGYMDDHEVRHIASFIAKNNAHIPYVLLAFYPQYYMYDLPSTSRPLAEHLRVVAKEQGVKEVIIGNKHLLR